MNNEDAARTELLKLMLDPAVFAEVQNLIAEGMENGTPFYLPGLLANPKDRHVEMLVEAFSLDGVEPEDLDAVLKALVEEGGYERHEALQTIKAALEGWEKVMDEEEAALAAGCGAEASDDGRDVLDDVAFEHFHATLRLGRQAVADGVPLDVAVAAVQRQIGPLFSQDQVSQDQA